MPDEYTQRQQAMEYNDSKERFERKLSFVKNALLEANMTTREVMNFLERCYGSPEAAQQKYEDTTRSGIYKNSLIKILKEKYPAKYNEAMRTRKSSQTALVRLAESTLSKQQIEKIRVASALQAVVSDNNKEELMRHLEDSLTPATRNTLEQKLETYRDILEIPVEEQQVSYLHSEIETLRGRANTELANNPEKRQQLLDALAFADTHLTRLDPKTHDEMREKEKYVQHLGAVSHEKILTETAPIFQNGKYDKVFTDPKEKIQKDKVYISQGQEAVMQEIKENGVQISDALKTGIRRLVGKMKEMQILKPGEAAPGEDSYKIYGFLQFNQGRKKLENAIKGGNIDEIIAAGEEHRKNWQDMEQLYSIAKENLGLDPTLFPGNLDSCRNKDLPAQLTFDIAATGAVNGAFLIYVFLHTHPEISMEEYLENPLGVAYKTMEQKIRQNSLDTLTQDQPFDTTLDMLFDFNGRHAMNIALKSVDIGAARTAEFLNDCDPDKERQQENMIRARLLGQYHDNLLNLERGRFGVLSRKDAPEQVLRTLQNLITVKPGDEPVSALIDGKNVDKDMLRGEDFSLDHYAAEHADYDGMIARTESLLAKVQGKDPKLTEQILIAAQEAFTRTLKLHNAERDTPAYQQLLEAFRGLESKIPENSTPEFRNRMATRRENLEMTLPGASATSKWTGAFYDQMEQNKEGMSPENREQLTAVLNELRAVQEMTAPFYEADQEGNLPKVTEEDYTRIREAYVKLADAIGAFKPQEGNQAAANVASMMNGLKTVVGQDIAGLSAAKQGEEASLSDMLKSGRNLTATVNGPLKNAGDMASTRFRIDVPGPDGKQMKGFFTPNSETYTLEDAKTLMEAAIQKAVQKYNRPDLAAVARDVVTRELNSLMVEGVAGAYIGNGANIFKLSRDQVRSKDKSKLLNNLISEYEDLPENEVEILKTNAGADFVADVIREMAPLNTAALYNRNGLKGNLDRRNSAMSTVADILGASHLVAGSRPMTIVNDGKEITGTFMSFAEGWDASDPSPLNPLSKVTADQMVTKESLTSLADLQVLDVICGNIDRHNRNFFYQFDNGTPPKFIGVQGIDNDFSFIPHDGGYVLDPSKIGIITEHMAQKVMTLTPALLETVLSPYGLSKEEIDAAWERTHQLQGQIQAGREYFKDKAAGLVEEGHLRVVKEEELGDFGLGSPLYTMGIFAKAVGAPVVNNLQAQAAKETALDDYLHQIKEGVGDMEKALNLVVDANRGFFIGSKAYDNALKSVREVVQARNAAVDEIDPEKMDDYVKQLEESKSLIATYLINKTKIPQAKRNALENRRIDAMSQAYMELDKESIRVSGASAIAKKLDFQKDPERMARKEELEAGKAVLACRIQATQDKAHYSKQPEYECDVMKQFREQVGNQLYEAANTYDGKAPTEEQKAELVNIMANSVAYAILENHIRSIKTPEGKQDVYRQLQEHPEMLTVVKANVVQSPKFMKTVNEELLADTPKFRKAMGWLETNTVMIRREIMDEMIQKMREYSEAKQASRQVQQPVVSAPKKEEIQNSGPVNL
jgi:hypothetical protein